MWYIDAVCFNAQSLRFGDEGRGKYMGKFVIIDGNSLLHRAYHALPPMNNHEGVPTQAVYGFLSMLFKVIEQQAPTHMLVAFDTKAPTPRHIAYSEYKAGRKPTDEELRLQFPIVKDVLRAMQIAVGEQDGYEADDYLGIFSRRGEEAGHKVFLFTGDKDALQLITENTIVILTQKGISQTALMNEQAIEQKYGVTPKQLIEVKGLMGDPSDNIPGIPGVGEKTALKLITQYGTVENTIEHAAEISGKALREKVETYADQARMSRMIGIISTDVNAPIALSVEECIFDRKAMEKGKPLLQELELRSIINRLPKVEGAEEFAQSNDTLIRPFPQYIHDAKTLAKANEKWSEAKRLSFVWKDNISLSDGKSLWVVQLKQDMLTDGLDPMQAIEALKPLWENEAIEKRLYDAKGWMHELAAYSIEMKGVSFDAMIASYLLKPNRADTAPELLVKEWLDTEDYDAAILDILCDTLAEKIEEEALGKVFYEIEMPLVKVLYNMEAIGCEIDEKILKDLGTKYDWEIAQLQNEIHDLAGEDFNILSPKQLSVVLFEKLGLPVQRKTKTGYSTDVDTLEAIEDKHPIVRKILEYRTLSKLKSTYIDGLLNAADQTGRVHSTFKQTVTATGRISSTEPNLQNIPVRTDIGREIRKAFIASEGNFLVGADYSQIELRVLAHMAQDPVMIEAFRKGEDIHARTAAEVAGCKIEDVTNEMRSAAKAVNFGIVYGISDFGLARQLGITRKEASEYIQKYLDKYEGIRKYMHDIVEDGKKNGYVTTLFGRRRNLPELKSSNYNTRSFGERAAMNAPIQGTAADIIKLAMIHVDELLEKEGFQAKLILQIHDELIIDTPQAEVEQVKSLVDQCMESVIELKVPLVADVKSGLSWYDTK